MLSHAWRCSVTTCLRLRPGLVKRADLPGQFYSSVSAGVWVCVQDPLCKHRRVGGPWWPM